MQSLKETSLSFEFHLDHWWAARSLTSGDTILTWTTAGTVAARLTAAGLSCGSCGTRTERELPSSVTNAVQPFTRPRQPAEYKQVTVLFADVVHSMDIAAAVGAERLREIMAELVDRACGGGAAVRRHGGQVHR